MKHQTPNVLEWMSLMLALVAVMTRKLAVMMSPAEFKHLHVQQQNALQRNPPHSVASENKLVSFRKTGSVDENTG